MTAEADFDDVIGMTEIEQEKEMEYVFSTIGSSWEFVHYTFYITDVTRAFTHQLVRHRVGVAFAQQAQRVGTQEDFGYMTPPEVAGSPAEDIYDLTMEAIQAGYNNLLRQNVRPQDARGVLPTNIHTNILVKVNLRALSDMLTVRLCLRAQGEFQNVARKMQELVLNIHPWASPVLAPNCLRYGVCKFPRYADCPISQKHKFLKGMSDDLAWKIRQDWEAIAGYDPQPTGTFKDYDLDDKED
jgi:flavin-dependent thymidylate synthase